MDADGNNIVTLTNNPANDVDPCWSPDGKKIAFTSDRNGNNEIYIMDSEGSDHINITNNPAEDHSPAWCCSLLAEEPLLPEEDFILVAVILTIIFLVTIYLGRRRIHKSIQ